MRACFPLAAVVIALVVPAVSSAVGPEEDALFREVVAGHDAARRAVRTVQCSYTYRLGEGNVRECRYARDGEKTYHAHLARLGNGGVGFPAEKTWDGSRTNERNAVESEPPYLRRIVVTDDGRRAGAGAPTPEQAFCPEAIIALGFVPSAYTYTLTSAREAVFDDHPCVRMTFDVVATNKRAVGTLTAYYAKDLGWYPVGAEMVRANGLPATRHVDVEVASVRVDGRTLFYPAGCTVVNGMGPEIRLEVDRDTLVLNGEIPASRFTLTPYPSEAVEDWVTKQTARAADPKWVPDEPFPFPFGDMIAASIKSRAAQDANRPVRNPATRPGDLPSYTIKPVTQRNVAAVDGSVARHGLYSLGDRRRPMSVAQLVLSAGLPEEKEARDRVMILFYPPGVADKPAEVWRLKELMDKRGEEAPNVVEGATYLVHVQDDGVT